METGIQSSFHFFFPFFLCNCEGLITVVKQSETLRYMFIGRVWDVDCFHWKADWMKTDLAGLLVPSHSSTGSWGASVCVPHHTADHWTYLASQQPFTITEHLPTWLGGQQTDSPIWERAELCLGGQLITETFCRSTQNCQEELSYSNWNCFSVVLFQTVSYLTD